MAPARLERARLRSQALRSSLDRVDTYVMRCGDYSVPATVGEILVEEFMRPMGLTQGSLAAAMGVRRKHVNELCNDRHKVTASTALILARVFGNSPDFWLASSCSACLGRAEGRPDYDFGTSSGFVISDTAVHGARTTADRAGAVRQNPRRHRAADHSAPGTNFWTRSHFSFERFAG